MVQDSSSTFGGGLGCMPPSAVAPFAGPLQAPAHARPFPPCHALVNLRQLHMRIVLDTSLTPAPLSQLLSKDLHTICLLVKVFLTLPSAPIVEVFLSLSSIPVRNYVSTTLTAWCFPTRVAGPVQGPAHCPLAGGGRGAAAGGAGRAGDAGAGRARGRRRSRGASRGSGRRRRAAARRTARRGGGHGGHPRDVSFSPCAFGGEGNGGRRLGCRRWCLGQAMVGLGGEVTYRLAMHRALATSRLVQGGRS